MTQRAAAWKAAPFLFGSGFCALIYQVAWQREFRLVFGASTAASAAVVAIFMGALGLGGWILGRHADRRRDPWRFYARLEALVAITAALTPPLLLGARALYLALGGTTVLGGVFGTLLRLALATLVLLPPMFLAGGTLPAAARAVELESDRGRRSLAVLYGINTLGALAGAVAATFALLEAFGTRTTLWLACLLNLAVAVLARGVTFRHAAPAEAVADVPAEPPLVDPRLVFAAAGIVGFAFFLMELVWYRMLGPILGGTVYTFGLTLAVALLGIGLGGLAYALLGPRRPPGPGAFALSCLAEAACLAVPFALGDRVAALAMRLRPPAAEGLADYVTGWTVVASLVVLPAAIVAGAQFPLLVALLGRGREAVGRHLGQAYAWNTVGAIAGALAGGFGLLPLLSAPGAWRATALALAATGLAAAVIGKAHRLTALACLSGTAALAVVLFTLPGPTAAWRHSGVGVGRAFGSTRLSPNTYRAWVNQMRRVTIWEAEGVESSIALNNQSGLAFVVNGKVDGNARGDAPTQVMSGLLGALLHPHPRSALVVGLGTGSTAGWLAAVPSIRRTDVVELEPAIAEVARASAAVNRRVMEDPRVSIRYGDAREVLMTTRSRYDLIFSEPSNPYRAGVASLFTRDFYRSAADRLEEGGLFLQWMQSYEVDEDTFFSVLATLASVFESVEVWQTHRNDLLLVGSARPRVLDVARLAERTAEPPFREALRAVWRAEGPEEVLARFVAGAELPRLLLGEGHAVNTDDRNHVEFGFARTVGRTGPFRLQRVRRAARAAGADRPPVSGAVDWRRVAVARISMHSAFGESAVIEPEAGTRPERALAHAQALSGLRAEAALTFLQQPEPPIGPVETTLLAEGLAEKGDERAAAHAARLAEAIPAEGAAVMARLRLRQGRHAEAAAELERAFLAYRADPWPSLLLMSGALGLAGDLARVHPPAAPALFAALAEPFPVYAVESDRLEARLRVAEALPPDACREALAPLERPVAWTLQFLIYRHTCYDRAGDPRASLARADLDEFLRLDRQALEEAPPPRVE